MVDRNKVDHFGLLVSLLQQARCSRKEVCSDLQRKEFCKRSFPEGLDFEVLQTVPELLLEPQVPVSGRGIENEPQKFLRPTDYFLKWA